MIDEIGCIVVGCYRLIIVISFCYSYPFISMEYPSLSHLINVGLKSTLSEISIAISACFQGTTGLVNFLLAFHSQPLLISVNEVGLL
jgi:hypothetical protein